MQQKPLRLRLKENFHQFNLRFHKEKEMVAFRKTLLLLAVFALTAAVASAQFSPPAFQCSATAVTPILRGESHADWVGDALITCTGGTPTAQNDQVPLVNVRIFLNTNVTSKLLGSGNFDEAMLTIDEPAPANQRVQMGAQIPGNNGYLMGVGAEPGIFYNDPDSPANLNQAVKNVFVGSAVPGQDNAVEWLGVPVDPPGTQTQRTIRITNVRADAAALAGFGGLIPSQVYMYISMSSTSTIPITFNQQLNVGFVQDGLTFSTVYAPKSFLQCNSQSSPSVCSDYDVLLKFKENFPTAFKTKGVPTSILNTFDYDQESGWAPAESVTGSPGVANYGTRLLARFGNVQAGVKIYVYKVDSTNAGCGSSSTISAGYVSGANSSGNGGSYTTSAGWASAAVSSQAASATWEVYEIGAESVYDTVYFGVAIAYTANTTAGEPGLGTSTVRGSYAPLDDYNKAATASSHPVPRFLDDSTASDLFTINACSTSLLWPYVTNQAGFDTGMVISNTSMDPPVFVASGEQAGACTIYYYGTTTGGGAAPAPDTIQEDVPAGGYAIWTLSSGGSVRAAGKTSTTQTIAAASSFEGYVIAICQFQYAHGYAFISDLGASKLSQGYLALILDEHKGSRTPYISEALNQ